MNTNLTQEQISALVDGELDDSRMESVLAALRQADGRAAWEMHHRIGDALRSDDIALTLSPDFTQRLFARLDAEPTIVAPALAPAAAAASLPRRALKRFAVPGMVAAAAVATVAFITTPQLMVADGGSGAPKPVMASVALEAPVVAVPVAVSGAAQEEVMLRDPRIDEYLFAHQRFSSSVYSTAQFARSATFAANSGK